MTDPDDAPITIVIDVTGCTCEQRTAEQLADGDVCEACVRHFDLDRLMPWDGDGD